MRPQGALDHPPTVTPFAGVWIEMFAPMGERYKKFQVTPFAGVWIEIVYAHLPP